MNLSCGKGEKCRDDFRDEFRMFKDENAMERIPEFGAQFRDKFKIEFRDVFKDESGDEFTHNRCIRFRIMFNFMIGILGGTKCVSPN